MPLYDYTCNQCEHHFETLVFNGETVECPECHNTKLTRHLGVPARPKSENSSACRTDLPPCGPGCCRL